jgi:hypothetical protein
MIAATACKIFGCTYEEYRALPSWMPSVGIMLAARGFEVTAGFLERVRNLRAGSLPEVIHIF